VSHRSFRACRSFAFFFSICIRKILELGTSIDGRVFCPISIKSQEYCEEEKTLTYVANAEWPKKRSIDYDKSPCTTFNDLSSACPVFHTHCDVTLVTIFLLLSNAFGTKPSRCGGGWREEGAG
jgi:hypothetical protein